MKLSARAEQMHPSATLAVVEGAKALKRQGHNVVSFGAGEPDFDSPPAAIRYAQEAMAGSKTHYTPAAGIPALRETVCDYSRARFGLDYDPGQVVVATMHKAKGLEWDCVFLTSLNNYNFPSGDAFDSYQSEKWFVRDDLNLEAEVIAQLETLLADQTLDWYQPGAASLEARQELIRERLRLFYVGITRARRWLTVTWNTGRMSNKNVAALPFISLLNTLEETP